MPLLDERRADFTIEGNRIRLSPHYLKSKKRFKKITGTRMGAVLGKNKYVSPALVWADIVGIYREEMDPMNLEAGNRVEPKVRDYVSAKLDLKFKTYDARAVNYDVFKEDDVFGGIPDGEQIDEKGEFMYDRDGYLLEIKTASKDNLSYRNDNGVRRPQKNPDGTPKVARPNGKFKEWFPAGWNGGASVPPEYLEQMKLYMYLRNCHRALLVVGFLEPVDYVNESASFVPEQRHIKVIGMKFDRRQYEPEVAKARQWYEEFVKTGISPPLTEKDREEWAH